MITVAWLLVLNRTVQPGSVCLYVCLCGCEPKVFQSSSRNPWINFKAHACESGDALVQVYCFHGNWHFSKERSLVIDEERFITNWDHIREMFGWFDSVNTSHLSAKAVVRKTVISEHSEFLCRSHGLLEINDSELRCLNSLCIMCLDTDLLYLTNKVAKRLKRNTTCFMSHVQT